MKKKYIIILVVLITLFGFISIINYFEYDWDAVKDNKYLKIKNGNPIIRKIIQSDNGEIELQAMNMWNFPTQNGLKMEDIEVLGEVVRVENKSAFK